MSTQRSDAQIEASRNNAALSRLSVTGEGKAAGSRSGTRRAFVSGTRGRKLNCGSAWKRNWGRAAARATSSFPAPGIGNSIILFFAGTNPRRMACQGLPAHGHTQDQGRWKSVRRNCGDLDLSEVQREIAGDWISAYIEILPHVGASGGASQGSGGK